MSKMIAKLKDIYARYEELSEKMSDPAVIADTAEWTKIAKAQSEIAETAQKYAEYAECERQSLQAESLVECDGLHIYLTAKGAVYAEEIYERHCVIREFLALLGVNSDDAEADACEMEHVVSSATFEAIKKFVENNKK